MSENQTDLPSNAPQQIVADAAVDVPPLSEGIKQGPPPVEPPPLRRTKRRWWLWLLLLLMGLIVVIVALLYYWTGTNAGTQRILGWIAGQQKLVSYRYSGGNLRDGVILDNVKVSTKAVDVTVAHAVVHIGWRALLQREVHFSQASLHHLYVMQKNPPTGKPFDFKPINLPVTLRFDDAFVHDLQILQPTVNPIVFPEVHLQDAVWAGDELSLKNSSLKHSAVQAQNIDGEIKFNGLYPLTVSGQVIVPALANMGLTPITVNGTGTLDTLNATAVVQWPDKAVAKAVVHPVRKGSPYQGTLDWKNFNWPFAQTLQLHSNDGHADVQGTAGGLSAVIKTDLSGKNIPRGQYQARASTDFKGLDIQQLNGDVLDGQVLLDGRLDWAGGVRWKLHGQTQDLVLKPVLPAAALAYLPSKFNANLTSVGQLGSTRSQVGVVVRQPNRETWVAGVGQAGSLGQAGIPMMVDARWQNLSRTIAGIGPIDSRQGQAMIRRTTDKTGIELKTTLVDAGAKAMVPAGVYQARVGLAGQAVQVPELIYQGIAGRLNGSAQVTLPKAQGKKTAVQQPLRWQAAINTRGFNPSKIVAAVPLTTVTGQVVASGESTSAKQTIAIKTVDLSAQMAADGKTKPRPIQLKGQGQIALLMNQGKTSGLKSFGAVFDGALKTPDVPNGTLALKVNGTPSLINIERFAHDGAAGQINAQGQVSLAQGPAWTLSGKMNHFNPGFFVAGWAGDLTGQLQTSGHWQAQARDVSIRQLDIQGTLRQQPISATGQLELVLPKPNGKSVVSFIPKQFEAKALKLDWAGNSLVADGNAQRLEAKINAPALQNIHPSLRGKITGLATLTGQLDRPDMTLSLDVSQLVAGQIKIDSATVRGNVPQLGQIPSTLTIHADQVIQGTRKIDNVDVSLNGTQQAHVLDASAAINKTLLSLRLAGGLRDGMNWIGQLQNGQIKSKVLTLAQQQPAELTWTNSTQQINLAAHCWNADRDSHLCLTEPLLASAKQGNLAVTLQKLDMQSFRAFMPDGLVWSGLLNGQAKAGWQAGQQPTLDAQIYTENGNLGLTADDPQDPPLTLPYDRLSLIAQTQADGMKIRFDAKTPGIGTGYVDAIVDPKATPMTVNGALVLDNVEMSIFQPFFAGMRTLQGTASLAGGMSGPLTGPQFYGEFRLKNGRVAMADLPVNLDKIQLHSSIRGTQATLDGEFYSGDGRATLDGKAVWAGEPRINLNLSGNELLIRKPPLLTARLSPKLDMVVLPTRRQVSIDGRVDIPSALITPAPTDDDAVAVSSDVRVIDRRLALENPVLKAVKPWRIDADIDVILGNAVYFRGFGANAPLGGQLNIRQRGTEGLSASGEIAVQRSVQVEAFGQNLLLKRGAARFNGSLTQPILDIEATKSISGRTVGVRVGGRLSRPGIAIFNDAGLTEQEALNALLTGRISANNTVTNTAGFKSEVNNTVAAAGLSLGLSGSRNFTNQIGRGFGLSGLTVDAEGVGDDTQVNVTGYISPDLYLRYGVGVFTPVNKLTLRYQVNRRLYVEASSSLEKAVDMFYNWRF